MGHYVSTIIAPTGMLRNLLFELPGAQAVPAKQGLSFIPLSDTLIDKMGDSSQPYPPFQHLTENIERKLRNYSADCPIAYVETEYFGGTGSQAAVSWINSDIDFPATISETTWDDATQSFSHSAGRPINQALDCIGVEAADGLDEFDSIGLGDVRSFDD
ncbi:MAG: hypothetical protein AAGH40_14665 [Verrucomicrobiota bacterium]